MEFLEGQTLLRKDGEEVTVEKALEGKEIIGFYFSAHWCPPCRTFTPILADFYEELIESGKPFEIIFISSDHSQGALFEYMKEAHGDWLAAPHKAEFGNQISSKFGIRGIPSLVIVRKDGTVVTTNGRSDVETKGARVFSDWS